MMPRLLNWWHTLPTRQQLLLLLMFALLVLWIMVQLVWRPIAAQNERLRARNDESRATLVWMEAAATEVRQLQAIGGVSNSASDAPLSGQINSAAQRAGLLINRLQPAGANEARVWIEHAPYDKVMTLLNVLESEAGIKTRSLTLNSGRQPGLVNLQGALVRGGAD